MPTSIDDTNTDVVEVLEGQMSLDADTAPEDPVSTIVDIVPVNGEVSEPLSPNEVQTLEHYEQIIAQGIKTFVQVGHALLTIREHHLYRARYSTFEDYCRQRWDLSRPRAYQLMDAAQVIDTVSTIVDIAPANEAQARPLTSLPPAQQVEVWREVVETAPPSGITAKHVQATVRRATGKPTGTRKPKSAEDIAEESEAQQPEITLPKATQEQEWLRRFDAYCVRVHEFLAELTRAGGVEIFVRGWEPENRARFIDRATFWAKRLDDFRRHLEKTINGTIETPAIE